MLFFWQFLKGARRLSPCPEPDPALSGRTKKLEADWKELCGYPPKPDWSALEKPPAAAAKREYNPLVAILDNAATDAERAEWLLRVPLGFVQGRYTEIHEVLEASGYRNGVTYVEVLMALLSERRDPDGYNSMTTSRLVDRAAVLLRLDIRPDAALLRPYQRHALLWALTPPAKPDTPTIPPEIA